MNLIYVNRASELFYSFPEHEHPHWEIILTFEGLGTETIEKEEYPLSPGTVMIIPPGFRHSFISEKGLRDFSLAFQDFVPIIDNSPLSLSDPEGDSVYSLMNMILLAVRHDPPNKAQLTESLSAALYQLLCAYTSQGLSENNAVTNLKQIISRNIGNSDFDLGKAMEETGYSKGYLRRIFHQSTKLAPLAWMNVQRVEFAAQTFRQYAGLYTVKEVGLMSGFSDPYYFSRVFRKHMGKSPSAYIESYLHNAAMEEFPPDDIISL